MRYWLFEVRGYRDVWLLLTTAVALWAVLLTFSTASETHESLCALRGDLERRVVTQREYLRGHPHGAPGIPLKVIQQGIANQQRTVHALRKLDCR